MVVKSYVWSVIKAIILHFYNCIFGSLQSNEVLGQRCPTVYFYFLHSPHFNDLAKEHLQ